MRGDRIRKYRELRSQGLSYAEIGRVMNVSQNAVRKTLDPNSYARSLRYNADRHRCGVNSPNYNRLVRLLPILEDIADHYLPALPEHGEGLVCEHGSETEYLGSRDGLQGGENERNSNDG